MNFLIKLLISALAVMTTAYLLPGVRVDGFLTAIIVAAVLSFLNSIVKPIMILLTIPVTIFSLGLFLIVINAIIILMADWLVKGFEVRNFWVALLFNIVLWLVTAILETLGGTKNREKN
jgi:putative membrane protein